MQTNDKRDEAATVELTPEFLHKFYYDNPPAQVDLEDTQQVVLFLRALLDLHDLLERGYDAELQPFLAKLREKGWGGKQISEFMLQASYYTRYEALIDPPIPTRGDQFEFENNSYRWKH